ncbi:MAG TPA: chorismate mutase [Gaiellaceae bacterium]|nr:chorismate mutase [Gaiellaceae bacterium]
MSDPSADPTIQRLRGEISEADRAILAAVNARIELVAELKRHKEALGLPFVDPERERRLLEELVARNGGPLSPEGLRELYDCLLSLTKREVSSDGDAEA